MKELPIDIKAEQCCLGACLASKFKLEAVFDKLRSSSFYDSKHRMIFNALEKFYREGDTPTFLTLTDELISKGLIEKVGGGQYIRSLELIGRTAPLNSQISILQELDKQRSLLFLGKELIEGAGMQSDVLLSRASETLSSIYGISSPDIVPTSHLIDNFRNGLSIIDYFLKKKEDKDAGKSILTGLPTGWTKFDEAHDGFDKKQLVILAARPAMGKSEFAIQTAFAMAKKGIKSLYFSLEMSREQIMTRMLSILIGVQASRLDRVKFTHEEGERLRHAEQALRVITSHIEIEAAGCMTAQQIQARTRRLCDTKGIDIVIVDHLSKMAAHVPGAKMYEVVTHNSSAMKSMAQSLDIPVLLVAQLNRDAAKKGGARPTMAEIRDSGHVEQDADKIFLLHRPDYYNPDEKPGVVELIIEKNREGHLGPIAFAYDKMSQRLEELPTIEDQVREISEQNKRIWNDFS